MPGLDLAGAGLGVLALGGITYALVEQPPCGLGSAPVLVAGVLGLVAAPAFVMVERNVAHPMLPLDIFASRQFSAAHAFTFTVDGGFGAMFFLLVMQLQVVSGSPRSRPGYRSCRSP